MTVIAGIAIPGAEFELGQVLAGMGSTARIDLTQVVPMTEGLVPYFWLSGSHDQEAFEASVRGDPRVASLDRLDGAVDRALYRVRWNGDVDGFFGEVQDNGILIEEGIGTHTEWRFRLRAADREALSRLQQACTDEDIPLDIRQVFHNPTDLSNPRYGLTDKQYEAVMLAFNRGYFHVPRDASQTDLSDEIGISRQAFSRRLSRGLNSLIGHTLLVEADRNAE